jgi:hypothetical protein
MAACNTCFHELTSQRTVALCEDRLLGGCAPVGEEKSGGLECMSYKIACLHGVVKGQFLHGREVQTASVCLSVSIKRL